MGVFVDRAGDDSGIKGIDCDTPHFESGFVCVGVYGSESRPWGLKKGPIPPRRVNCAWYISWALFLVQGLLEENLRLTHQSKAVRARLGSKRIILC